MHDGDDVILRLADPPRLDARIVGRRARFPHHAITQIMRRQKQILRGGARPR